MATTDEWWKTPATATPGLIGAASIPEVEPVATTLNQGTDTVSGQIKSIIDADSPLMQQAKGNAAQSMNARGLLNTSINTGAAQSAVLAAATPIAQADAGIYSTVNRENTAAQNTAAGQNAQINANMTLANADIANKTEQFNASQSNDLMKTGMDIASKQQLANTEASFKTLMQGNQSASEIYKQATKNIADVMANKDMGQDAKDVAVSNQIAMLSKGLEITGAMANLNLAQYLDFTGVPA